MAESCLSATAAVPKRRAVMPKTVKPERVRSSRVITIQPAQMKTANNPQAAPASAGRDACSGGATPAGTGRLMTPRPAPTSDPATRPQRSKGVA